jgi:hypothetical protein
MIYVLSIAILLAIGATFVYFDLRLNKLNEQVDLLVQETLAVQHDVKSYSMTKNNKDCSIWIDYANGISVTVKDFTSDDERYNVLCAEELLDKLNEKYDEQSN